MPAVQRLRQTADWLPRRITADGRRVNSGVGVLPANLDAADVNRDKLLGHDLAFGLTAAEPASVSMITPPNPILTRRSLSD